MPSSTLRSRHSFLNSIAITPDYIKSNYLFGINLCKANGEAFPDSAIQQKVDAAIADLENRLGIDITPKCRTETLEFYRGDFQKWGYLETTYHLTELISLSGKIGEFTMIDMPVEWETTYTNSDDRIKSRIINIIPIGSSAKYNQLIAGGLAVHVGLLGYDTIPNFWQVEYRSGFKRIPPEISDVVSKMAVINIYNILADLELGAGISSQSLSFDGFSKSVSTTASAMYSSLSAKVEMYKKELEVQIPNLENFYRGLIWDAI